MYELGSNAHNHPVDIGAALAAQITSKVKARAVADVFKPASAIVEDVLLEDLEDVPCPSLSRQENIARAANRRRQRLRPKDPQDLEFELATDYMPSEYKFTVVSLHKKKKMSSNVLLCYVRFW